MNLISIVTPAYNCSKFVEIAVQSIVSQTYEYWELLIIEDQSTDDTWQTVKTLASSDDRIKIFKNERNMGPAFTRNRGIEMADGDFIAFLDADDQWHPKKLQSQLKFMQERDVDFSYTSYNRITEEGEFVDVFQPDSKINYSTLLKSNQIGCLTAMYNAKVLGKIYMPDIRKRQDFGLWLDILKHPKVTEAQLVPSEEPLATYRIRINSVSSNKFDLIKYNWALLREHQKLSIITSAYYLGWQIYSKLSNR